MEDKNMARIELNEQNLEDVVGGAFNFYYDPNNNGARSCYVDNVGNFTCTAEARDRLTALKLEHKKDHWSAQQYVNVLVNEGYFHAN